MPARILAAQPRQNVFLYKYMDVDEVFFGGQAGGGKSIALCLYQGYRRQRYPGSNGLMLRRRFTDLNQPGALIPKFRQMYHGHIEWNENKHEATWPNGSITKFGYIASNADVEQYQGAEYDDVCWDEVTQFTEYMYTYLYSRTRVTDPHLAAMGMRAQIRSAGNPGGIGHGYFRRRFVKACRETVIEDEVVRLELPDGTVYRPTRVFVPSALSDNESLLRTDPYYRARMMMLPEKERRMLLEGDWDVAEGQFFTEFREHVHVVDPVVPPAHWRRWIGFDWGYAAPWVALWFAQDPDTRQVIVYREASGARMSDSEIAREILEASAGERIQAMHADPSIWAKKNHTSTADIIQDFKGWNIDLRPANNDRIDGWRRVREYLAWEPDAGGNVAVSPLLKIGRNCRKLIETIPDQMHDEIKVEDLDTDGFDHYVDGLRYGLVSRPVHRLGGVGTTSVLLLPR